MRCPICKLEIGINLQTHLRKTHKVNKMTEEKLGKEDLKEKKK